MSKYKYHGIYDITFYKCDEDGNEERNADGTTKIYTSKQNIDLSYVSDWFDIEDLTDYHEQIDNTNNIVPCKNGVGEWEISPIHETFDTREEAEKRLKELKDE